MTTKDSSLWDSGYDETVEVNQRALIDKVLARYSGEFTVFRELLQNSDDAESKTVEIHFQTQAFLDRESQEHKTHVNSSDTEINSEVSIITPALPNLQSLQVHHWEFRNDGKEFQDSDWTRLKKIAEGNPDEEKIGAFGVGFYSLFSVTENPFVKSGEQWMRFHWNKDNNDQLLARRFKGPGPSIAPWTIFSMPLRQPGPIPNAFDFTRFLASSITFMAHLKDISVWVDQEKIVRLVKNEGIGKEVGIPRSLRNKSPRGIMTVKGIKTTPLHIKADIMRWVYSVSTDNVMKPKPKVAAQPTTKKKGFFSSLFSSIAADLSTPTRSSAPSVEAGPPKMVDFRSIAATSVSLSIYAADVAVHLDKKMEAELHRSTKKKMPPRLAYKLIYTAKDEYDASLKEDECNSGPSGSIFQGLRADLDGNGQAKIFIGHATGQTTGIGGHMSSRFIPTVERESIDLVDQNVAIWNKELLYVGGFLSRAAYELEVDSVRTAWIGCTTADGTPDALKKWLTNRAVHALRFFTFYSSTPSSQVSAVLESAFFDCAGAGAERFPVITTVGVRNISDTRLPDISFDSFVKALPVLPEELVNNAKRMVDKLDDIGYLRSIEFEDILQELRERPLNETEMVACLKWWMSLAREKSESPDLGRIRTSFLNAAIMTLGTHGTADERIINLKSIQAVSTRTTAFLPKDGPLPSHLFPLEVASALDSAALLIAFPCWHELTTMEWFKYVVNSTSTNGTAVEYDLDLSAAWAERVFTTLSLSWPLSRENQQEIHAALKDRTCMPTNLGMKKPDETYFLNANIFQDLPVITFGPGVIIKGNLEKILHVVGVRKHVELQLVFDRMVKTGEWQVVDLIKYLVSVQSTLSASETQRLKHTAAFSREAGGSDQPRVKLGDLYEPKEVFRELGLPILDWGAPKWRPSSDEAKFMFSLGLQKMPPLPTIIGLCASPDAAVRTLALKYLLDNIESYPSYDPANFSSIVFVPCKHHGQQSLGTLQDVYTHLEWKTLGYKTVDVDVRGWQKLKLPLHPSTESLISLLTKTPPSNPIVARAWFEVLTQHQRIFSGAELTRISNLPIVPIHESTSDKQSVYRWITPRSCYVQTESQGQLHSKLFTFVDFGSVANGFLTACGTKSQPSVDEIAQLLVKDPTDFFKLAGSRENYLLEIRNLALHKRQLSSNTLKAMRALPCLLAFQRQPKLRDAKAKTVDLDDDDWDLRYDLRKPLEIVIADDTNAYQLFGDSIWTAPQEDTLEEFYLHLGSKRLSTVIRQEYKVTAEIKNSRSTVEMRALILERLPLFLHEHTHTQTQVSYKWLSDPSNFTVKSFGKISVSKRLDYDGKSVTKLQDASAISRRIRTGPIEIWLAGHSQIDMFEVSIALCNMLFNTPKINDTLLFMTILSTDLKALRRRGYNVDRILRKQKEDKEMAEAEAKSRKVLQAQEAASLSPPTKPAIGLAEHPMPGGLESVPPPYSPDKDPEPGNFRNFLKNGFRDQPDSFFANLGKKVSKTLDGYDPQKIASGSGGLDSGGSLASAGPSRPRQPVPGVTPHSNVDFVVEQAISRCLPERQSLFQNRSETNWVKEATNEGYCDISGRDGYCRYLGNAPASNTKVYVSQGVPSAEVGTLMMQHGQSIKRFDDLLAKVVDIFALPQGSMHIFYDMPNESQMIGFNRNGSIFLNLRFYEAWHDADVAAGECKAAWTSWYFTLAHEIAHNLVGPHNSEHEFYFSAICEKHLNKLAILLR